MVLLSHPIAGLGSTGVELCVSRVSVNGVTIGGKLRGEWRRPQTALGTITINEIEETIAVHVMYLPPLL